MDWNSKPPCCDSQGKTWHGCIWSLLGQSSLQLIELYLVQDRFLHFGKVILIYSRDGFESQATQSWYWAERLSMLAAENFWDRALNIGSNFRPMLKYNSGCSMDTGLKTIFFEMGELYLGDGHEMAIHWWHWGSDCIHYSALLEHKVV